MKILLLSERHHKSSSLSLSPWLLLAVILLSIVGAAATSSWYSYKLGLDLGEEKEKQRIELVTASAATIKSSIDKQTMQLQENKLRTLEHLNALALKLGQLQSHMVRLNALGERLTTMGKLDTEEFDFKKIPGSGGIDTSILNREIDMTELMEEINSLALVIEDREVKLEVLESMIMNQDLQKELQPYGRPVNGFISSKYGPRLDPFTGKKGFHDGVDIAGRRGSLIKAVAPGIVVFSGTKKGYGKVVKVQHGNGYVTLYGHNKENLVKMGDYVVRGQKLAKMGSTGRSTGPHVHFEVQVNGKSVNPDKYLRASR